jgi:hypothetical protein
MKDSMNVSLSGHAVISTKMNQEVKLENKSIGSVLILLNDHLSSATAMTQKRATAIFQVSPSLKRIPCQPERIFRCLAVRIVRIPVDKY